MIDAEGNFSGIFFSGFVRNVCNGNRSTEEWNDGKCARVHHGGRDTIVTVVATEHSAGKKAQGKKNKNKNNLIRSRALQIIARYCARFGAGVVGSFGVEERSFSCTSNFVAHRTEEQ